MNNGMTFGMDGPSITGWWVNTKTGDKFKAVDTFFEDNNLLVKTADGRLLNYNQLQNYIQTDKPEELSKQVKSSQTKKVVHEAVPASILSELETPGEETEEDLLIPDDNIWGDIGVGAIKPTPGKRSPVIVNDFDIIHRALEDKSHPSIEGVVSWKKYPESEIKMLCDIMRVSPESIVDYYISQISIEDIAASIKESIGDFIIKKLDSTEEPPKKTTKKK